MTAFARYNFCCTSSGGSVVDYLGLADQLKHALAKQNTTFSSSKGFASTMTAHRKLSEIMKEMSELLLRDPGKVPSSEAAHVALFFANVAWNECVGLDYAREGYRSAWEAIEAENPALWKELKSNDIDGMIDELVEYKKAHYPNDRRRILTCGIPDGSIRVEWLPAAAPGVDVKWETRLYGLVRTGNRKEAIHFLQETRGLSRTEAAKRVAEIAVEFGVA